MRVIDTLLIIFLLALLIGALYLLWINLPKEQIELETFKAQVSENLSSTSAQFYPNMRYPSEKITFMLSQQCTDKKQKNFRSAVEILEEKTILEFEEVSFQDADIIITCSNIAPTPEQENHFVAGEGGPSLFINTTKYAAILKGEIALYRPDSCESPQIALHELLHALGFDHNNNQNSIMFPITNCAQKIDDEIIEEINKLYAIPSLPDLEIESIEANTSGRYLNFEILIANQGLKDVDSASLDIVAEAETIKTFELENIDIGAKRYLTVSNLRIPRKTERITFIAKTPQQEISKSNNEAVITLPS